jgi:hypothetical protein
MKRFKQIIVLVLVSTLSLTVASQQGSKTMTLSYTVGIPTGNLKSSIDKPSFRGFEAAYLYQATDQLALGLQVGYQDFYQKYPRQVFSEAGYDLSAVITNSVQTIPVMVKESYGLSPQKAIQPFVSLAAGGNVISYEKYYGEFVDSKTKFGFAAQPEAGIHIPFGSGKQSGFHVAAGYNFMPFTFNEVKGLSHIVLKAGVRFSVND